jgi:hypothetical protein
MDIKAEADGRIFMHINGHEWIVMHMNVLREQFQRQFRGDDGNSQQVLDRAQFEHTSRAYPKGRKPPLNENNSHKLPSQ